jgi:hypothetical protein
MSELQNGELVAIEINNAEPLRRNIDVIRPRRRPLTKDALTFLLLLKAAAAVDMPFAKNRRKRRPTTKTK